MTVKVTQLNDWKCALKMARFTVNKEDNNKQPSNKWITQMLLSEHSPIREVRFLIEWNEIKTWVAQHIARHDFGGEHHAMDCAAVQYGATQRTDRTGLDRDELSQSEPTNHSMTVNAQDLINISRKRLCRKASKETREAWKQAKNQISILDIEMSEAMVSECVYRGFCPENNSCNWNKTEEFKIELKDYRNGIQDKRLR